MNLSKDHRSMFLNTVISLKSHPKRFFQYKELEDYIHNVIKGVQRENYQDYIDELIMTYDL